jgi:hypothetical protein
VPGEQPVTVPSAGKGHARVDNVESGMRGREPSVGEVPHARHPRPPWPIYLDGLGLGEVLGIDAMRNRHAHRPDPAEDVARRLILLAHL